MKTLLQEINTYEGKKRNIAYFTIEDVFKSIITERDGLNDLKSFASQLEAGKTLELPEYNPTYIDWAVEDINTLNNEVDNLLPTLLTMTTDQYDQFITSWEHTQLDIENNIF